MGGSLEYASEQDAKGRHFQAAEKGKAIIKRLSAIADKAEITDAVRTIVRSISILNHEVPMNQAQRRIVKNLVLAFNKLVPRDFKININDL
jgi:hypothetical protein